MNQFQEKISRLFNNLNGTSPRDIEELSRKDIEAMKRRRILD